MKAYENAIGEENMKVLSTFSDLPMYNFGLAFKRRWRMRSASSLSRTFRLLGLKRARPEDAIAIRQLKDINQAERLLIVRRQKRMKKQQEMAQQNSQMQAQQQAQAAQAASQARQQEMQMEAQIETQKMQMKNQLEIQLEQVKHQFRKEIETIRLRLLSVQN